MAPSAGVVPSANVGVPDTDPVSTWVPPAGGAGIVAVHVMAAPGSRAVWGQVIAVASESVTVTGDRRTSPVFLTSKVTDIVDPTGTDTPGARLASSALSDLTMVTAGWAGVIA